MSECCNLNEVINTGTLPYELQCETNYLSMTPPGIGRYLLCMVAQAIIFFLMVLGVEARVFNQLLNLVFPPTTANSGTHRDMRRMDGWFLFCGLKMS